MLYYIYLYTLNPISNINLTINIIFICCIIFFIILNLILIMLNKLYNNNSTLNKKMKENYIDIYEIDLELRNPIEFSCLKNSRLPNKRDIISLVLYLINKKYISLRKNDKNKYYIQKTNLTLNNDKKISLSKSEVLLLNNIPDKECDFKNFIYTILKKNTSKEILNSMILELNNKFKIKKRHIIFDLFFLILKYVLIGTFFILITNIFLDINFKTLSTFQRKIIPIDFVITIFETITLTYIFYIFNHKLYNYILKDNSIKKFYLTNFIILFCFLSLFLLIKPISTLLIYLYVYSLMLVLINKRIFVSEKNTDLKITLESFSLYNYLNNYSLLKEKEMSQIKLYDILFTYAFAFEITSKTNKYLNINKIFPNQLLLENKINFDYFINSNFDFSLKKNIFK